MKKNICLFIIFVCCFSAIFAQKSKIYFVQKDGSKIEKEFDTKDDTLVLFDTEGMHTVGFENLQDFKKVKILELQTFAFLDDLDFLSNFSNLEELYIGFGVKFYNLDLRNLKKLKTVNVLEKQILIR